MRRPSARIQRLPPSGEARLVAVLGTVGPALCKSRLCSPEIYRGLAGFHPILLVAAYGLIEDATGRPSPLPDFVAELVSPARKAA